MGGPRPQQEEDLRNMVTIGTFNPRTRNTVATAEALQVLELLNMRQEVVEVLHAAVVVKGVRIRMRSQEHVAAIAHRLCAHPAASDITITGTMWAN